MICKFCGTIMHYNGEITIKHLGKVDEFICQGCEDIIRLPVVEPRKLSK